MLKKREKVQKQRKKGEKKTSFTISRPSSLEPRLYNGYNEKYSNYPVLLAVAAIMTRSFAAIYMNGSDLMLVDGNIISREEWA